MENKTIKEFTDLCASKAPTPGGGGVCACVSALAASLSEMVTNLTIGKAKYIMHTVELEDIRKETNLVRSLLLECINKDEQAFLPLSKAYKMDKEDPNYLTTLEKCLIDAANSPLLILKYTTRIIDLNERLATIGSKISVSDSATSVMLASGVLYAAYINILVNTNLMKDREYAENLNKEAKDLLDEYSLKALDVYNNIIKRISENG